jgi:hypothetical protein
MKLSYKVNKHQSTNEFILKNDGTAYFMEHLEDHFKVDTLQRSYMTLVKKVNRLGQKDFLSVDIK